MCCRETAFALAKLDATVVLGCRNTDGAREVAQEIRLTVFAMLQAECSSAGLPALGHNQKWSSLYRERIPQADILVPGPLDLAKPESIFAFVDLYQRQRVALHILVNNAGAAYKREWYTAEGVGGLAQV